MEGDTVSFLNVYSEHVSHCYGLSVALSLVISPIYLKPFQSEQSKYRKGRKRMKFPTEKGKESECCPFRKSKI